ncbi:MAG: endonuclease/exonuclease/phosphatase family protein [Opitutales bacterium]|nr:endonuclease/exonuclease/phosphatase family protein [Opitutales bacterium]
MRKTAVFFFAALALWGAGALGKPAAAFNAASYNMYFLFHEPDHRMYSREMIERWEDRKDKLLPLLKFHQIDVCGTQELREKQLEYFFPDADYDYVIAPPDYSPNKKLMNNAIIFRRDRFELLESGVFQLHHETKWRHCVWAKFKDKLSGARFYFFNSHFPTSKEKKNGASIAANILAQKAGEIAGGTPFISTGDYNSREDTEAIKTLKAAGFADAKELSKTPPYGTNFTYNKFSVFPPKNVSKDGKCHIDFIFCSEGGFEVLKFGTLNDNCGNVPPSDHFPIMARLKIRGAKK